MTLPIDLEVYWKKSETKQEKYLKYWSFEKEMLSFGPSLHLKSMLSQTDQNPDKPTHKL